MAASNSEFAAGLGTELVIDLIAL